MVEHCNKYCPRRIVQCPLGCGANVQYHRLNDHLLEKDEFGACKHEHALPYFLHQMQQDGVRMREQLAMQNANIALMRNTVATHGERIDNLTTACDSISEALLALTNASTTSSETNPGNMPITNVIQHQSECQSTELALIMGSSSNAGAIRGNKRRRRYGELTYTGQHHRRKAHLKHGFQLYDHEGYDSWLDADMKGDPRQYDTMRPPLHQ